VTIYASIRGTGCSGGVFNLFDRRHAEDGYEIIENHIVNEPWSNGKVGIVGHSYPGLTGWMVATTNPPHLEAVAISGLIDDLYRGIVYPGGVPNYGFPLTWTGILRPTFEAAGNADRYVNETSGGDPTCAANIASRPTDAVGVTNSALQNPIVNGGTSTDDGDWWRMRSTMTWINGLKKPIHITQQFQDEQTGPRGGHVLFERIPESIPKRLVMTNGVHGTTSVAQKDRVAWLDCWMQVDESACDQVRNPAKRVNLLVETTSGAAVDPGDFDYSTSDWPAPETEWTRYFLHPDGSMTTTPGEDEATSTYVSTPEGRHLTADLGFGLGDNGVGQAGFVSGPDQLRYDIPFSQDTAIAGPINLTLTASSTAPNTDFFVDVIDVAPDGSFSYVQRGMQRASHREINRDPTRTDYTPDGDIYRAWHPHTNTTTKLLTPSQPETFEIEVFPIGHVFRAGHKLVMQIHAPPANDPLSTYLWVSGLPPAANTVFHSGASSVLLPVLPTVPRIDAEAPDCGALIGVPCFTPLG
ncbi:MAG TPA: CocE/NonD family hydrolase, partial [Acidimicrobiia bacterium]|nr:CocE/NonD family hydrolase [Acidimicrobiia bacterium]